MSQETTTRTLVEVKEFLDELLQVAGLDELSNGLAVGGRPAIAKVALAVNCSFQAIEGAAERGCDLLITHHAAGQATDAHLAEQKYRRLRQLGLNLYVAHECLDRARVFGTADALARGALVTVQDAFEPDDAQPFAVHGFAAGRFGEFVTGVGARLGTQPRAWKNTESFGHVAIIPGHGARSEWMAKAQGLGCDTLLTGEGLMFGLVFAREAGLNLILAGHYVTEVPGMMSLSARVARGLQLDVTFIPEETVEQQGLN